MRSSLAILLSGGGLALVRLISGVLRTRWIASRFGLEGVGLLAQATQFQLLSVSASSFSITAAMIQGARGIYQTRSVELFRTALFLLLVGSSLLALAVFGLGPSKVAQWLFGEGRGASDLFWMLASIPFILLSSAFMEAAFFVSDRFDRYVVISAAHSILQPFLFIGFTIAFGAKGILIAFPASAALLALLFMGDLVRLGLFDFRWFRPMWNKELALFLTGHGASMFLTGVGGGFLLLFVRSSLVSKMGLAENGILQVPIALSAYGGAVVTNFIWGRIHPAFSKELKGSEEGDISFAVASSFVVAISTWALAPAMIPLVYSRAFLAAVPMVGIQTTGDVLYFGFFTLAVTLLAMGRIRTYVVGWAFYYAPYALTLFLPGWQNVRSIVFLHLFSSALAFFALLSISAVSTFLPSPLLRRLGITVATLTFLAGIAAFVNPESLALRILIGSTVLVAGLAGWRFIYGDFAQMPELNKVKMMVRKSIRLSGMDRFLASLLRSGVLPRSLERIVPQYRDYPIPTLRELSRDGLSAKLDLSDLPDWKAYFRLKDKKRERMYSMITPGSSMLEIGCAKGWVALNLAQIIGRDGSLIAVDAHQPSVREAGMRLSRNGFSWARAECIAFSDQAGFISLEAEAEGNSASVSVSHGKGNGGTKAIRLDDWLRDEKIKDPDTLKISVNGWEYKTLQGGLAYVRRRRPLIFIEIGDQNLRRAGSSAAETIKLFDELGYRLETLWGNSKVPTGEEINGCLFDAVALPR